MPFDPDAYLAEKQAALSNTPNPQPSASTPQGFDPDAYLKSKGVEAPQSLGQKALGLIGTGARALDSVTGAPLRAGISAAQNVNYPSDIPGDAARAAWKQFGNMKDEAPTGEDIVKKAGVPSGSASKIAGFAMDLGANPLNFVGAGAKLAGKGAEALSGAADTLSSFANEKALKAAGAMSKDLKILNDKGTVDALGSYLLDNKIVKPLSTVSQIADRLEEAKATAGQQVGHLLDQSMATGAPTISARDVALELSQDPEIANLSKIPGKEGTAKQINNYLGTLYENGDSLSLREAQMLRQGIDSSINFNKRIPDMAGAQPYLTKMRNAISDRMNDAINAMTPGGEVDALKSANQNYSKLSQLETIANNRAAGLAANRGVSLTDTIAGVGGLAMGHTPMGAAAWGAGAALANKAGRTFGNGVMATGANAAAKGARAAPGLIKGSAQVAPAVGAVNTGLLRAGGK